MNIQTEGIQKIDHHQLPVPAKIRKNSSVPVAVPLKIPLHRGVFQHRRKKESDREGKQHTVDNLPTAYFYKKEGAGECHRHPGQKVQRYLLIILTDGEVKHRIKHENQCDITAKSGKHKNQVDMSHKMFPHAKRNSEETCQQNI